MITIDILEMLFDEFGLDFQEWITESGYNEGWSDQKIYEALPSDIQGEMGDILMNTSWYHGGM